MLLAPQSQKIPVSINNQQSSTVHYIRLPKGACNISIVAHPVYTGNIYLPQDSMHSVSFYFDGAEHYANLVTPANRVEPIMPMYYTALNTQPLVQETTMIIRFNSPPHADYWIEYFQGYQIVVF